MYASYDFYKNEFHGAAIVSESSYFYYGEMAAEYIEQATFGRASAENIKVKKCECRVAELLAGNHENLDESEREIKSESVGGWSKTFAENKRTDDALSAKISDVIRLYLGRSGLLYCGIGRR